MENQFYPVVLEKLSQRLQRDGYHVLLFITDTRQTDAVLAEILQYQVDGMVMASTEMSSALALRCEEAGIPVVLFNRISSGSVNTSSVTTDNYQGGQLVGHYLASTGHTRVAYIAGLEDTSTNQQRERWCAMRWPRRSRASLRTRSEMMTSRTPRLRPASCSRSLQRPDAVFVANDHMAIAVMDTLRIELGLRVPQDVMLWASTTSSRRRGVRTNWSSVVQDADAMIEATVGLLMEEMDGENQNRAVVLPTRLVLRASSAPRTPPKGRK